jgi:hypothetical protein
MEEVFVKELFKNKVLRYPPKYFAKVYKPVRKSSPKGRI